MEIRNNVTIASERAAQGARTRGGRNKKRIVLFGFAVEGSTMRCESAGSEPVWHEAQWQPDQTPCGYRH